MKPTYKPFLTSALAMAVALPVMAQAEGEDGEMLNAAFRKVAAEDNMGGTSTLNVKSLMEKNYFTYTLDNLQGYVGGWNGTSLWGMADYLVMVDGVRRDANNVLPEEIEDITFMKGAQAVVLYGSQAAHGVVLITTRRGQKDNLNIRVKANTGWNVAKSYPEYLGAAEYMTLYNEARANDGLSPLYDQIQIWSTANKTNPYRYPDVNLYTSDYIKKAYNRWDVSTEFEGGNKLAHFYSVINYYRQGDFIDFGEAKRDYTDRLAARGNVDLRMSDYVKGYINASATYYNQRTPVSNSGTFWEAAAKMRPNRYAPLIDTDYIDPNATTALNMAGVSQNIINGHYLLGGLQLQDDRHNIIADYYAAGKRKWTSRQFQFDAGIDIDLEKVLKGLSFHTQLSVDYQTSYATSFNNTYAIYQPSWSQFNGTEYITGLDNFETVDKHTGIQTVGESVSNQVLAANAHFDYNRTFASDHNVSAMVVVNAWQRMVSGQYHKLSNANLGFLADYNYKHKYYAEYAGSINHSAKLPVDNRNGLSQSVTLGWNLANEDWMQDKGFDMLKLSVSGSTLKTDIGLGVDGHGYYDYLGTYNPTGAWTDWNGGSLHQSVQATRGENNSFTFIDRNELSVNLQGSILKKKLTFDLSYFQFDIDGKEINNSNIVPSYFHSYYPDSKFYSYMNYEIDSYRGVDFSVNYQNKVGDFEWQVGLNGTYFKAMADKRDDSTVADAYQYKQGTELDAIWGYECLGFYKDMADIAASPTSKLGDVQPGDLKYKDQNGDGVIDNKDQINLGRSHGYYDNLHQQYFNMGAPFTFGVNLTAKWKNLTLFMLGVGNVGGQAVRDNDYWRVNGEDKYSSVVRDRAIIDNSDPNRPVTNLGKAKMPSLTTGTAAHSYQTSDFWIYSTNRFDLAKVQLTYDFDSSIFDGQKVVKGLQLYVSGSNLLTLAPERETLELNIGSEPQARFYNVGLKVNF